PLRKKPGHLSGNDTIGPGSRSDGSGITLDCCPRRIETAGVVHVTLQEKIDSNSAVVGVIGLGYVGLPLLAAFAKVGFPVMGFDVDPRKIDALNRGENYLKHLG